jgi:uncharacterized protein (TIGR02246 family)
MKRLDAFSSIVLAIAVAGCMSKPAAETASDSAAPAAATAAGSGAAVRAAIEATEKQWSAAFLKGDAAAVAALYTDDAATVPPAGEWFRGRDGITKLEQAQLDSVNVTAREDVTEEVTVTGDDYAVEIGHYAWSGTAKKGGGARGESGRYMVLWKKGADGTWKLYRDLGATAPPTKK